MSNGERRFGLSKSKIAAFEQCPKRLWLSVHRPELAKRDKHIEAHLAIGHEVGAIACSLLPSGIMVEAQPGLSAALSTTRALLEPGPIRPIFEATLQHDGVLVRIDILEPDGTGAWRIAEVKSTTSVKDYHLCDLATQLWAAEHARLPISSAAIRHINRSFVLKRPGEYQGLFVDTDVLPDVAPLIVNRATTVAAARAALAGVEPDVRPGEQCNAPFPCEFTAYCGASLTAGPQWPVTILPHGGGKQWLDRGIDDLLALDPAVLVNPIHERVHRATATGNAYHDVQGARAAMAKWPFPRAWLDFETIGFAVPRWVGTRPFQQVPFQFSVHVEGADGRLDHHEFLSLDGTDPRRSCAEALLASIPSTGAVIGYNASFEKTRILELACTFPDLAEQLRTMAERVVDLLPVTRAHWYHRDQRGSWSIKAVLPTIAADFDYSGLEVKDGLGAQQAYVEAASMGTTEARRRVLERALRAYCRQDTQAMVILSQRLCGLVPVERRRSWQERVMQRAANVLRVVGRVFG